MNESKVLPLIAGVRSHLARVRPLLGSVPPNDLIPEPGHVLTNTDLLLKTLDSFYRRSKGKTPYLPRAVTGVITTTLLEVDAAFSAIVVPSADEPTPPDQVAALSQLLIRLDDLYAHCLMYG